MDKAWWREPQTEQIVPASGEVAKQTSSCRATLHRTWTGCEAFAKQSLVARPRLVGSVGVVNWSIPCAPSKPWLGQDPHLTHRGAFRSPVNRNGDGHYLLTTYGVVLCLAQARVCICAWNF